MASFEYKVVEQKQRKFLRGAMTAKDLEDSINQHAIDGWILDRIVAGETAHFVVADKDVFLLIFRRERR